MLVGVAFLPSSFLPSGKQPFYIINRPNCHCNKVYIPHILCFKPPVTIVLISRNEINHAKHMMDHLKGKIIFRIYCSREYKFI